MSTGCPFKVWKKLSLWTAWELTSKGNRFSTLIPDSSWICHFFLCLEDAINQVPPDTPGYLCRLEFIHAGFIVTFSCLTWKQANPYKSKCNPKCWFIFFEKITIKIILESHWDRKIRMKKDKIWTHYEKKKSIVLGLYYFNFISEYFWLFSTHKKGWEMYFQDAREKSKIFHCKFYLLSKYLKSLANSDFFLFIYFIYFLFNTVCILQGCTEAGWPALSPIQFPMH